MSTGRIKMQSDPNRIAEKLLKSDGNENKVCQYEISAKALDYFINQYKEQAGEQLVLWAFSNLHCIGKYVRYRRSLLRARVKMAKHALDALSVEADNHPRTLSLSEIQAVHDRAAEELRRIEVNEKTKFMVYPARLADSPDLAKKLRIAKKGSKSETFSQNVSDKGFKIEPADEEHATIQIKCRSA